MAAGLLNILVEKGADFSRTLTIESTPGVPLNLTNYSFTGHMKRNFTDSTYAATFNIVIANVALGTVNWTLPHAATANLVAQTHHYDINMINSVGNITIRLLEGDVFVSNTVE